MTTENKKVYIIVGLAVLFTAIYIISQKPNNTIGFSGSWKNTIGSDEGVPATNAKCKTLMSQYKYWKGLFALAFPKDGSAGHIPADMTSAGIVNKLNEIYGEMVALGCACGSCGNVAMPPTRE